MTKRSTTITASKTADGYVVPMLDGMGNPIIKPDWYPGDYQSFVDEVHTLKPHHCSYPSGQIQCTSGGRCCKRQKTAHVGLCREHMPTIIPSLHRKGMTRDEMESTIAALVDPELCDMKMNVIYAEKILTRARNKAEKGGFSQRSLATLETITDKLSRHHSGYEDAVGELSAANQEKQRTDIEDYRKHDKLDGRIAKAKTDIGTHLNGWRDCIAAMKKLHGAVTKDEINWQEFSAENRNSTAVKEQVARVDVLKKEVTSNDEVRRLFMEMFGLIEEVIGRNVDPELASLLLNDIYSSTQKNQRAQLRT